jgi:glucose-1-phosphate thymidylyltransferase
LGKENKNIIQTQSRKGKNMKGIILAGGYGTRLYPLTLGVCKQLLPIYNKPMVYYPLSILMLSGIREILIISTQIDLPAFKRLLKDGTQWGLHFDYVEQPAPHGIADAFLIKPEFLADEPVGLVLGDNIFYGAGLAEQLIKAASLTRGSIIFAYFVREPNRYGVVEFDQDGQVISIEEKPKKPKSNYAIPGLYFFDQQVSRLAQQLKPSQRGELEITDLCKLYLQQKKLRVEVLSRGTAWLDAGTHESLLQASNFINTVEERQGMMIACPEEIAYHLGYIGNDEVKAQAKAMGQNLYAEYLLQLVQK